MSSPGSLSWSLADRCSVVSFFAEFSSSAMPLFTTTDGGRRSSGGEQERIYQDDCGGVFVQTEFLIMVKEKKMPQRRR